jgi:hypothetical protein
MFYSENQQGGNVRKPFLKCHRKSDFCFHFIGLNYDLHSPFLKKNSLNNVVLLGHIISTLKSWILLTRWKEKMDIGKQIAKSLMCREKILEPNEAQSRIFLL